MTLPTSGPISIGMVAAELGIALPLSLGDARVRALAGVPSGPIRLGQLRGKSATAPGGGGGGGGGTPTTLAASIADVNTTVASGGGQQYTASVNISIAVMGGQAPYSFAWSKVAGVGTLVSGNSPTATMRFTVGKFSQPGDQLTARAQCVVTDAMGAVVSGAANITLTLD